MMRKETRWISKNPIVSSEAYRTFISLIFSAGMAAWGATLMGFNPLNPKNLWMNNPWFIWNEPLHIQIGGVLYGIVLVCLFWIYIERLTIALVPGDLWVLVFDFIALSFLAGAAVTWNIEGPFVIITFITLFLLVGRFWVAWQVGKAKFGRSDTLLRDIFWLYASLFAFGALLVLGSVVVGTGVDWPNLPRILYWMVNFGMLGGISITGYHAFRHITAPEREMERVAVIGETTTPSLCPAYGEIPKEMIVNVAKFVFKGERQFRDLLKISQDLHSLPLPYHLSRVHTYRDVETQAFIMAHHAKSPHEIELRSVWVYLAHWFDDMFDNYHAEGIANMEEFGPQFDIGRVLQKLDQRLNALWERAVEYTLSTTHWQHRDLLELGMRRLILGGPLFSDRCRRRRPYFLQKHRELIDTNLNKTYGVQELIAKESPISDMCLAYTAKVVVEIWDSFSDNADFDLSMLMNLFFAPGLYYHDSDAEQDFEEISPSAEEDVDVIKDALKRVVEHINGLPGEKRLLALKPVPLFVKCFEPILQRRGLLPIYKGFVRE